MRRVADLKGGLEYINKYMIEHTGRKLISDWLLRREVNAGNIPSFRIGHRILLDLDEIDRWIENKARQSVELKTQPEKFLRRAK